MVTNTFYKSTLFIFLLHTLLYAGKSGGNTFTPNYSFSNIAINYLDWTQQTHNLTEQEDFAYISVEGGAGWDSAELYAIVNLENPMKTPQDEAPKDLRYTLFADFDIKVKDGWRLHFQDYYLRGNSFYVNDFVVGASYKYVSDFGLWIKPFIGAHLTNDTYFDGWNGYMTGWTFNYDFKMWNEKFSLFQWNEIEFARAKAFYEFEGEATGDGRSYGLNGALSLWWHINPSFTTGVQYRYADNKLGSPEYQSAMVYSMKYNF